MKDKTIYLCGPINGRSDDDCRTWREEVKQRWDGPCLDPMRRDYRGREHEPGTAAEIVGGDLEDIQNSDALLVYFDAPSVGTSMEVFYAKHVLNKEIALVNKSERALSPWLIHHSDYVTTSVSDALAYLRKDVRYIEEEEVYD